MNYYAFIITFIWAVLNQVYAYRYDVSVCSIFQNEARFLKEWIEYHRLLGVEKFYLYNNNSSDGYGPILNPYIKRGIVELIEWPYDHAENHIEEWNAIQCSAYQDAIQRAKYKTKWLAIIDLDEFIVVKNKKSLAALLKEFKNDSAVVVNWQMFGTSGVEKIPPDKLMIEVLTQKALKNHPEHFTVKSIVRPEKVLACSNPHFVSFHTGHAVTSARIPVEGAFSPAIHIDSIQINHYWLRDQDYLRNIKYPRMQKVNPAVTLEWMEARDQEFSRETDTSILFLVPKLKKAMKL